MDATMKTTSVIYNMIKMSDCQIRMVKTFGVARSTNSPFIGNGDSLGVVLTDKTTTLFKVVTTS